MLLRYTHRKAVGRHRDMTQVSSWLLCNQANRVLPLDSLWAQTTGEQLGSHNHILAHSRQLRTRWSYLQLVWQSHNRRKHLNWSADACLHSKHQALTSSPHKSLGESLHASIHTSTPVQSQNQTLTIQDEGLDTGMGGCVLCTQNVGITSNCLITFLCALLTTWETHIKKPGEFISISDPYDITAQTADIILACSHYWYVTTLPTHYQYLYLVFSGYTPHSAYYI